MDATTQVYDAVSLPPHVSVEADLLGTAWEITTAPCRCRLLLPAGERPHGEDRQLSAPLVSGPSRVVELLEDLIHVDGDWAKWGAAHHWRSVGGEILEAWLRCAVLEIDVGGRREADRREQVGATRQAVGAWASILFDWIEVQGVLVWSEHAIDWRWFGGLAIDTGLSPLNWYQPDQQTMTAHMNPSISYRAWAIAVDAANACHSPHAAHQYLRDASGAQREGNLRRAVIDAATAVEIALTEATATKIPTASDAERRRLFKSVNGLIGLVDLAAALDVRLSLSRNTIQTKVSEIRNLAAHTGAVPTEDEVKDCLVACRSIVFEVDPLPA